MSPRLRLLALAAACLAALAGCGGSELEIDEERAEEAQAEIANGDGTLPVPDLPADGDTSTTTTEETETTETTTTSEDDEVAVGYPDEPNEICDEVRDAFAETQTEAPRSYEQAAELMSALVEISTEGEEALAAITPPEGFAEPYEGYLEARLEVIELIEQAREAAEQEDGEAYADIREEVLEGAGDRAELAREAGLRRCAAGEGA